MSQPMNELKDLKSEEDALDQSIALNRITLTLLQDGTKNYKRVWIALMLSILVNLLLVWSFLWYEGQWELSSTETTTITQDSGEGEGNNIYQSGENATYLQGASSSEEMTE